MRTSVSVDGMRQAVDGAVDTAAEFITDAMRGATGTLKLALRDQILGAGMGQRLANTWRGETYPENGHSLSPAGYVWSNAPDIITTFASGATIRPHAGKDYLWIPSKNVPRAPGRGRTTSTKKMTPDQVLAAFRVPEFIIKKGRQGRKLAFIAERLGSTARGSRKRVKRGRLAHGSDSELILMFTLTSWVTPKQKLDLDAAAQEGAADFTNRVTQGPDNV